MQPILPVTVSGVTFEMRYYGKCMSAATCPGITFAINNPCSVRKYLVRFLVVIFLFQIVSAPAVTFNSSWVQYTVNVNNLLANCSSGFQVVRWSLGARTGQRIMLDSAIWYCNGVPCDTLPSGGGGGGRPPGGGFGSVISASLALLAVLLLLAL